MIYFLRLGRTWKWTSLPIWGCNKWRTAHRRTRLTHKYHHLWGIMAFTVNRASIHALEDLNVSENRKARMSKSKMNAILNFFSYWVLLWLSRYLDVEPSIRNTSEKALSSHGKENRRKTRFLETCFLDFVFGPCNRSQYPVWWNNLGEKLMHPSRVPQMFSMRFYLFWKRESASKATHVQSWVEDKVKTAQLLLVITYKFDLNDGRYVYR